jgi:hypothetical protein
MSFAPLWLPAWHTVRLEMGPAVIFGVPTEHCMHAATGRKHCPSDWPGQCGSQGVREPVSHECHGVQLTAQYAADWPSEAKQMTMLAY